MDGLDWILLRSLVQLEHLAVLKMALTRSWIIIYQLRRFPTLEFLVLELSHLIFIGLKLAHKCSLIFFSRQNYLQNYGRVSIPGQEEDCPCDQFPTLELESSLLALSGFQQALPKFLEFLEYFEFVDFLEFLKFLKSFQRIAPGQEYRIQNLELCESQEGLLQSISYP